MPNHHGEYFSDLEYVPPQNDAPEVVQQPVRDPASAPQVVPYDQKHVAPDVAEYHDSDIKKDSTIPSEIEPAKSDRKIMGLRRTTFFLVLLVLVLIVGGAVGGGVGATVGKNKNSDSSPAATTGSTSSQTSMSSSATTSTPSSTESTSSTTSPTATSAPLTQAEVAGCPAANNTIYTASTGTSRFLKICALEMPGPAIDITSYNTTTFDACIDKCAQLNFDNNNATCVAVTWDLRAFDYKICYLKDSVGQWRTTGTEDNYLVTALLIGV